MSTRESILSTTARILSEQSPSALTLEHVAKQAGISKGGLLHHFPNKQALLQALLDKYIAEFEQTLTSHQSSMVQNYVAYGANEKNPNLMRALIPLVLQYPELGAKAKVAFQKWYALAQTPQQLIAMLATDGLWYAQIMGMELPTTSVHPHLKELAQ